MASMTWYAVMGEKTGADRYAFRLYDKAVWRCIRGGGCHDCGRIVKRMAGEEAR
ncbi:hypothetical protein ACNKHM_09890 [Shigella sonnei]